MPDWMLHPLINATDIIDRQTAAYDIMRLQGAPFIGPPKAYSGLARAAPSEGDWEKLETHFRGIASLDLERLVVSLRRQLNNVMTDTSMASILSLASNATTTGEDDVDLLKPEALSRPSAPVMKLLCACYRAALGLTKVIASGAVQRLGRGTTSRILRAVTLVEEGTTASQWRGREGEQHEVSLREGVCETEGAERGYFPDTAGAIEWLNSRFDL